MIISEMSTLTNISEHTLRYYEKKALITVSRDERGRRSYDENEVEWIRFIQRLKETGMLLRDIKKYSDLRAAGDKTILERLELLEEHRLFVLDEQNKWERNLDNLNKKIEFYKNKA
ncbi:MerR family transcriptional regulator [Acetobacterium bakii]|uniref:MerR family transcriptional regulator n=1 Tax=Acetobacterium bakii TaxID=52689 RepID=A0A0L6TZB7_9FIRM|nr:MerR family transcriptional regulator [Acetobacterium bakii]KNZ40895.1 MerR family transcriptional regulator [Acetobacterium bakii]